MEKISFLILIKELFSLRATVDILLIAAGMFILYQILLRSGTWKIMGGIALAMLFFFLASLLDLRGIEWIYSNLSPVAVIALIVIFQPELRKFLERAASVRRVQTVKEGDELIRILAESLLALSAQRWGALVVIPGKESVREWLSGGYRLDAAPSFPLSMSLFDPNSPGHDGALIVVESRFAWMGVRLPVSQTSKLPAELGTRHHAAMGLAEQSDALVFVVSEERGTISIFKNGEYKIVDQKEQIAEAVCDHWTQAATFPIEFRKGGMQWPTFSKILASIFLAIVFWSALTVSQGELLEAFATAQVEFAAIPPNLVLVGDKERKIRLHLAGSKSAINSISASIVPVKIDLSKAGAGKQTCLITEESVDLPQDVRLLDILPSNVEIILAAVSKREVVVKPQLVGSLQGNLKLRAIEVIPRKVKTMVAEVANADERIDVTTTPIYLDSVTGDTVVYCKIIAPPSFQPVDKRWPDVTVRLTVSADR